MSWFGGAQADASEFRLEGLETIESASQAHDVAQQALTSLLSLEKADGWVELSLGIDDKGLSIRAYDKADVAGSTDQLIKTEALLPFSPKEIYEVVWNENMAERKQWEPELQTLEVLDAFSPELGVTYAQMGAPFPVSARDFCSIRARERRADGTYLVWGVAVNHKARPFRSKFVRAKGASCWILHTVPGQKYQCRAVKVARVNPMGNIPTWVISLVKKKTAEQWVKLTDHMLATVLPKRGLEPEEEEIPEEPIVEPTLAAEPSVLAHVAPSTQRVQPMPSRKRIVEEEPESEEDEEPEVPIVRARRPKQKDEYQDSWAYDLSSQESLRHVESLLIKLEHNVSVLNTRLALLQAQSNPPAHLPPPPSSQPRPRLGWRIITLLFAWPVLVVLLYHFVLRRRFRAIRNG